MKHNFSEGTTEPRVESFSFLECCQAIFEGLDFSQLANSDERKLRQPRLFLSSIFLAVLFFVCKLLNRLFGNSANWSAFPDRCPCDLARPRLGRRTIGQIQETEVVFFHVACVHVACPVHGREDCWVEKPRPRS